MEVRASSLGKKSTAIVVQQVLRRFVRGACEGKAVQMDDKNTPSKPNLTAATRGHFKEEINELLTGLSTRMGGRFRDRESIHLSSAGWQALGLIFHDIIVRLKDDLSAMERDSVLEAIADIDWSRYNPDWIPLLGQAELDSDGREVADERGRKRVALSRGGRQTVWALADYMRDRSILASRLAQLEGGEEETTGAVKEPELELA
jgi:hypothetical protein